MNYLSSRLPPEAWADCCKISCLPPKPPQAPPSLSGKTVVFRDTPPRLLTQPRRRSLKKKKKKANLILKHFPSSPDFYVQIAALKVLSSEKKFQPIFIDFLYCTKAMMKQKTQCIINTDESLTRATATVCVFAFETPWCLLKFYTPPDAHQMSNMKTSNAQLITIP